MEGGNGSFEEGCVGYVSLDSFGLEELSCLDNFFDSFLCKGTVIPSCELVGNVPFGFAVEEGRW